MNYPLHQNLSRAVFVFACLLIVPRLVIACGCNPFSKTTLDAYERADLVIIARTTGVTRAATPNQFGNDVSQVTMVVEKVFKGDAKIGQSLTFGQGDGVLDCSWQFTADEVDRKYLLYLYRPERPSDPFYASSCNRSRSLQGANEDLLYLNNIDKLRGRTRISGVVGHESDNNVVEGHQIRISGGGKSYIATTDGNGVYEVYDLPPGRYSLEPLLKRGWKVDTFYLTREDTRAERRRSDLGLPTPTKVWFTLQAKKHFGASIGLRLANRVAGRVTTATGEGLNRVCVSFVPTKYPWLLACNTFTEADGSFVIQSVEAGSYYMLINYQNIRSSYQPFPKLYYPGVASLEAAKLFTVQFGESIEDLKFVVSALDETVTFEGVVRYANGRPASDRWVGFETAKTAAVDGSIHTWTDQHGRFSLTVLKGLRGEIFSTYPPTDREFDTCPPLKARLKESRKDPRVFETSHLNLEATVSRVLELRLPVSPCR